MKSISDYPPAEMYAQGGEIDCQCARCGSSMVAFECEVCQGDGLQYEGDGQDEMAFECDGCDGRGVIHVCFSSDEWCEANPLEGREDVPRGKIEWYVVEQP